MGKYRFLIAVMVVMVCPLALGQTNLRGWHSGGQTWLVWTDGQSRTRTQAKAEVMTYDIYVSSQPIKDLSGARLVGRLLPQDYKGEHLQEVDPKATWRIPDGKGGHLNLRRDQALFVYTPHAAVAEYFAVVLHGETAITPGNTVGPISQTLEAVQCHSQLAGTTLLGYDYTVYAHWIDGQEDENSGRPEFPVMGNAGANGTAYLFTVYEPFGGRPAGLLPVSLQFHGGSGSHLDWKPGEIDNIDNKVDHGFTVALDDFLWVVQNHAGKLVPTGTKTFWFGYWKGYDRFAPPTSYPPAESLVVDYTLRRIKFIIGWLAANYPIDPDRISAIGHSMGAGAVSFLTRLDPGLISAGTGFAHAYDGMPVDAFMVYLLGSKNQNLPTNLPGGLRITDFMNPATEVPDVGDRSFTRYLWGRQDDTIHWKYFTGGDVPETMRNTDAERTGQFFYWDERGHNRSEWADDYWESSPRLSAGELTRHRARLSFPAITAVDHAPTYGIQPNPGNGNPSKGDPVGTWGGHFDWDTATITDSKREWGATIFLIGDSPCPHDIPENPSATADVTIRKANLFRPGPGEKLFWTLRQVTDNAVVSSGPLSVPADGVVSVPGLVFRKNPDQRRLILTYAEDSDADGVDAQLDCDESRSEVWALPGEVIGLSWSAEKTTMFWNLPEAPGGALTTLRFDVIRSGSPDGFEGTAECLETGDFDRQAVDTWIPTPGSAWFYQVRAENICGTGAAGSASDGTLRLIRPCP